MSCIYSTLDLCVAESLLEISDDVLDVLTSDRDTDEFRAESLFLHDLRRNGCMGHASRVLDEGVEAAERDSESGELSVLDDAFCRLESVLHDEGECGAIAALHLRHGSLVVG